MWVGEIISFNASEVMTLWDFRIRNFIGVFVLLLPLLGEDECFIEFFVVGPTKVLLLGMMKLGMVVEINLNS